MCRFVLMIIYLLVLQYGCKKDAQDQQIQKFVSRPDTSMRVVLEFSMTVNQKVYQYNSYGDPPQIAIWIENINSGEIQTVWVTHCAGTNQWRGKVVCPVALPYWEYRHGLEKKSSQEEVINATTGATPRDGFFTVKTSVLHGSYWNYFIEVNAAGDYNEYFPYWSSDGMPDSEGNGQPSIIYSGSIQAIENDRNIPELLGRTDQKQPVTEIITNMNGIENARELIRDIQVISRKY